MALCVCEINTLALQANPAQQAQWTIVQVQIVFHKCT